MDDAQEYEVESVTRARVDDKRGKKITWKYYVKWKGYGWDESTWEPTDSFQGGSEHILESFWERIDTGGRDISDASAFKKGEELLVSGPPGSKPRKRKAKSATQVSPSLEDVPSSSIVTISAPILTPRKRRRVPSAAGDDWGYFKPKQGLSARFYRNGGGSARSLKRRRASSPGPRKSAPRRLSSAGDSQLDADGETDPDMVEVEDELMQVSVEDPEELTTWAGHLTTASENGNRSKDIKFDDLEHFYSGNPIDIDQNTDELPAIRNPEARQLSHSPSSTTPLPPDDVAPEPQAPASPTVNCRDPLFGSPLRSSNEPLTAQKDPILPHHRARAAKPLVKLIDTTRVESMDKQSRITAKARLMSSHTMDIPIPPAIGHGGNSAKRGGRPGPGRSSLGLITKSRSSLLTVTKGTLRSVKGKFVGTVQRNQPDEIEEVPATPDMNDGGKLVVTSWSDEDVAVGKDHQAQPGPPPSGDELLRLTGLEMDPEPLPDYEDDATAQPHEAKEMHRPDAVSASAEEEPLDQSLAKMADEFKSGDHDTDTLLSLSEAGQRAIASVIGSPSVPSIAASAVDDIVKKNIELAKEHLFPSAQASFDSFSHAQSSFRSTIFGPLYQGCAANSVPVSKNEFSTTFKMILGDGTELPLVLKDCDGLKARISDILIGNSSGSKVALFYSTEDASAMVSTFRSDGTARVVLDPSAEALQQERFLALLQRFQSSHTLIAPVGKEVCVLYSSENASIAERLGVPARLRGLSSTLLISHASIENQLAYVGAIMRATAL